VNMIESINANKASIQAIRRDLHAHPELCFEEQRTADVVAQKLTEWGIPHPPRLGQNRRHRRA
jgi:metal-dependent amidase/aminoacylase/carboxypeptidase family protein